MKRVILLMVGMLCMSGALWAQSRQLSPMVHIKGVFKHDYQDVKQGTPFVLQRVVKVKKQEQGVSRTQMVLIVDGVQMGLPVNMLDQIELLPEDKNTFWQSWQLSNDLISYYEKKGYQEDLRKEQAQEADDYVRELEKSKLLYDDAAVEDYLQCMLLAMLPDQMAVKLEGVPQVRVIKSPSPDMLMLANHTLLISTGLLATLDSEEELYALVSREVAHYVLDHAMITVNKNVARARRAEFWGAVADGVVSATEDILYERYDYYEPGLIFVANDIVQALVNDRIRNRMGLDYSAKQEEEADVVAARFLELMGKNRDALVSALTKVGAYYEREKDTEALSKYGPYGTLPKRLEKLGTVGELPQDRIYLKKMSSVVSHEAASLDYNKRYVQAKRTAMKNIDNGMACSDDYLMVARSIMKLYNTPESNSECLSYLNKAEEVAKVTNLNVCKMKILLLLRENKQMEAVDLLRQYQELLNVMYQQPHTEEDAQWIAAEHSWAEKLLDRTFIP